MGTVGFLRTRQSLASVATRHTKTSVHLIYNCWNGIMVFAPLSKQLDCKLQKPKSRCLITLNAIRLWIVNWCLCKLLQDCLRQKSSHKKWYRTAWCCWKHPGPACKSALWDQSCAQKSTPGSVAHSLSYPSHTSKSTSTRTFICPALGANCYCRPRNPGLDNWVQKLPTRPRIWRIAQPFIQESKFQKKQIKCWWSCSDEAVKIFSTTWINNSCLWQDGDQPKER